MVEQQLTIEAQKAFNELWAEQAIPFKLTAHRLEAGSPGHYTVDFLDARLGVLHIYWNPEKESFKNAVREAGKSTVGKRSRAKGAGQTLTSI